MSVGAYRVRPATPDEAAVLPDGGGDRVWIAVAPGGGPAAGHLAARLVPTGLVITGVWVDAAHRGRGVGATLLAAALDEARWRFDPALLAASPPDLEAFFARHGFLAVRPDGLPVELAGAGSILARRL